MATLLTTITITITMATVMGTPMLPTVMEMERPLVPSRVSAMTTMVQATPTNRVLVHTGHAQLITIMEGKREIKGRCPDMYGIFLKDSY